MKRARSLSAIYQGNEEVLKVDAAVADESLAVGALSTAYCYSTAVRTPRYVCMTQLHCQGNIMRTMLSVSYLHFSERSQCDEALMSVACHSCK